MSLSFQGLQTLRSFATTAQGFFDTRVYIVGGTVRDIILGQTSSPTDIDLTCHADPDYLRETMQYDETKISRFRTEKYGTISVIPKRDDGSSSDVTYELTPFRAESDYTDTRHPDTVQWSESLIADSARRDFTINALYWTTTDTTISTKPAHGLGKKNQLHTALIKHLPVVISQHSLLILTDHDQINTFVRSQTLPTCGYTLDSKTDLQEISISQIIIDPQGGLVDLIDRTIRTVGDPATRYTEDALRLMRGLRFVNTLNQGLDGLSQQNSGFDFEKRTRAQLVNHADLISQVASERHYQELTKVFTASNPFGYICTLKTAGMLHLLFPALHATINNHQPTRHHALDTYSHTIMVLYHLQQRVSDPLVRFATLYHDVGKPEQYAFMERAKALNPENPDREGFEHHADIGARIAATEFKTLSFPRTAIEKICWYIKRHHRPGEILDSAPKKRDYKLRKLMSEGGVQETLRLIDIAVADRLGQYNPIQPPAIQELLDMQDRVRELYDAEGRFTKNNLVVNGGWIMQQFDLTSGPQIGEILERVFQRVLGDVSSRNTEKEILRFVKGILKK